MNAQQLKNSILQFAMQGELVEQIPSEEPVKDLLERIQREKDQLIKDKIIKKEQPLLPITSEEIPFDIPETWQWLRLSEVSTYIQRGKSPKYSDEEKIPVISQKCVQWTGFSILPAKFIDPDSLEKYEKIRFLQDGDLLWNSTGLGTVGRIAIYEKKRNPFLHAVVDSHVTIVRCSKNISFEFVNYFISSFYIQSRILELTSGTTKQRELNTSTVKNVLIPIPPFEEQRRIVSKIKVLESEIERYGELYELNKSLESKFPVNIEKSILQYAMQGKLVSQDINDEPTSILLEKIKNEKESLVKQKVIKKEKEFEQISDEEIPFEIPKSWKWIRLGDIGVWKAGSTPSRSNPMYYEGDIPWLKTGELNDGYITSSNEFISQEALNKFSLNVNKPGAVLIAMYGATIGKLGILEIEATTNQACCACHPFSGVYNKFLFYYLMSARSKFRDSAEGGAQPNISRTKIINTLMPLPPFEEQKRIVNKIENILKTVKSLNNQFDKKEIPMYV